MIAQIPITHVPDLREALAHDKLIFQLIASAPARKNEITKLAKNRAQEIQQMLEVCTLDQMPQDFGAGEVW